MSLFTANKLTFCILLCYMKDQRFVCGGVEISCAVFLILISLHVFLFQFEAGCRRCRSFLEFMDRCKKTEYAKMPMNNNFFNFFCLIHFRVRMYVMNLHSIIIHFLT